MAIEGSTSPTLGASPNQQQMVRETLQAIVKSPEFSKSTRYPRLLKYIVLNTLEGNLDQLKERVIGMEVFNRPPEYDPSIDAIVRTTAGEVRRRMTAYFSEHPQSSVRIDLPIGGYAAEFHFPPPPQPEREAKTLDAGPLIVNEQPGRSFAAEPDSLPSRTIWRRRLLLIPVVLIVIAGVLASLSYMRRRESREFWAPVFRSDSVAVMVIGTNPQQGASQSGAIPSAQTAADEPVSNTALGNAIAAGQLCGVFRDHKRACQIIPVRSATLDELRDKTIVSIGGLDNAWSLRLLAPFRYQFAMEGIDPKPTARLIVDQYQPHNKPWRDDSNAPRLTTDYAIIARFHSDTTDSLVVIAAGISQLGTIRAAEYLLSPQASGQLMSLAPKGWNGFNFEAVLQIDVVQGSAGHVKVVATQFW